MFLKCIFFGGGVQAFIFLSMTFTIMCKIKLTTALPLFSYSPYALAGFEPGPHDLCADVMTTIFLRINSMFEFVGINSKAGAGILKHVAIPSKAAFANTTLGL
jgi:hypothetical protein